MATFGTGHYGNGPYSPARHSAPLTLGSSAVVQKSRSASQVDGQAPATTGPKVRPA